MINALVVVSHLRDPFLRADKEGDMNELWEAAASLIRMAMGSWGAAVRLCLIILAVAVAIMLYKG